MNEEERQLLEEEAASKIQWTDENNQIFWLTKEEIAERENG